MKTPTINPDEMLKSMAAEAVKQHKQIRTTIRDLTLEALQMRELSLKQINNVVRKVTEGISVGVGDGKILPSALFLSQPGCAAFDTDRDGKRAFNIRAASPSFTLLFPILRRLIDVVESRVAAALGLYPVGDSASSGPPSWGSAGMPSSFGCRG